LRLLTRYRKKLSGVLSAEKNRYVISAAMLLSEIGVDMSSFASSNHFCSWAGICPGNNFPWSGG
jgi:transposase